MAITGNRKSAGRPSATCECDECGRTLEVCCDYERRGKTWEPNVGQINRKLVGLGWKIIKKKMLCSGCAPQNAQEVEVSDTVELRKPSREQARQIVEMLSAVYDVENGRYTGDETDNSVAEAVGGGVMFGWVAEIREQFFGPDGGNEAMVSSSAALKAAMAKAREIEDQMNDCADGIAKIQSKHASLAESLKAVMASISAETSTIDRIRKSVGPKGR